MKEYKVNYVVDNEEVISGQEPYNEITDCEIIQAESKDEAISFFIDWVIDQSQPEESEYEEKEVTVIVGGLKERYRIVNVEEIE